MTLTLTVEEVLKGTGIGQMQSVGQMQVIPLLGDDDATFAPPELEAGTQGYGAVTLRNTHDRPTIVPHGAGWVVQNKAQDHAIGSGALIAAGAQKIATNAMCIQQAQPGLIPVDKRAFTILPALLRTKALAMRKVEQYNKLWESITAFNADLGLNAGGNLVAFLQGFAKELDQFVAEFERLPHQVGAIVLVNGEVVGVERAPSAAYFAVTWEPLIRLCYGSLALAAGRKNLAPPATRASLVIASHSLIGLRAALAEADARESVIAIRVASALKGLDLEVAEGIDDELDEIVLRTVAASKLAGQVVSVGDKIAYASLNAT